MHVRIRSGISGKRENGVWHADWPLWSFEDKQSVPNFENKAERKRNESTSSAWNEYVSASQSWNPPTQFEAQSPTHTQKYIAYYRVHVMTSSLVVYLNHIFHDGQVLMGQFSPHWSNEMRSEPLPKSALRNSFFLVVWLLSLLTLSNVLSQLLAPKLRNRTRSTFRAKEELSMASRFTIHKFDLWPPLKNML